MRARVFKRASRLDQNNSQSQKCILTQVVEARARRQPGPEEEQMGIRAGGPRCWASPPWRAAADLVGLRMWGQRWVCTDTESSWLTGKIDHGIEKALLCEH